MYICIHKDVGACMFLCIHAPILYYCHVCCIVMSSVVGTLEKCVSRSLTDHLVTNHLVTHS